MILVKTVFFFLVFVWLFFLPGFLVSWVVAGRNKGIIDRINFSLALSIATFVVPLFVLHTLGLRPVFWVVFSVINGIDLLAFLWLWVREGSRAWNKIKKWLGLFWRHCQQVISLREQRKGLILALILIFSLYFSLSSFTLWRGRYLLPEPDDSYTYVFSAKALQESQNIVTDFVGLPKRSSTNLSYFTYRYILIGWHELTGRSWEDSFKDMFLIGGVLMIFAVMSFAKSFSRTFPEWFFGTLALLLFVGSGSYHGFYWVVPSFFALYFFFVLWRSLDWTLSWLGTLLILFSFAVSHFLSFWLMGVFLLFVLLKSIFNFSLNRQLGKRICFLVVGSLLVFVLSNLALWSRGADLNYGYGPVQVAQKIVKTPQLFLRQKKTADHEVQRTTSGELARSLTSWEVVKRDFFGVVFANFVIGGFFILNILWLLGQKKLSLISLFVSLLIFVLAVSFFPYGFRSLLFLWPIVYLMTGIGIGLVLEKTRAYRLPALTVLFGAFFCLFAVVNIFYRAFWSYYLRDRHNFTVDKRKCASYLLRESPEKSIIGYQPSKEGRAILFSEGLYRRSFSEREDLWDYLVVLSQKRSFVSREQIFFKRLLSKILGVKESTLSDANHIFVPDNKFVKIKELTGCQIFRRI